MYTISNQERRDIMRLLGALKELLAEDRTARAANMSRVAGVITRRLERKRPINE